MLEYLWSCEVLGLPYGATNRLETTSLVRDAYISNARRLLIIYRHKEDPSLLVLEQDRKVHHVRLPESILSLSVEKRTLTVITVGLNLYKLELDYLEGRREIEPWYDTFLTFNHRLRYV